VIGGNYKRWTVILQEFDIELLLAKSKKYLVFTELISGFPCEEEMVYEESFLDEHLSLFLHKILGMRYYNISSYFKVSSHFFKG